MLPEGSLVYLLDEKGKRTWVVLNKGMLKLPSMGVVDGDRLLSSEDGAEVTVAGKRFWLLVPGASEMMSSVERGAQIIMPKDAATILMELNIKSGDKVLEAGVGSAALSIALLNQVRPWGQVISMEIRQEFADKGRKNIERAGLAEGWRLHIGDVRKDRLDVVVDAVVLDMPDPWDAVDNVSSMLRNGGRFCAYVPNTNQLEHVVRHLHKSGYVEVRCFENMQREMVVHEMGVRPSYDMLGHTGYLVFARKVSDRSI
ncbi:MAG: tRNA (adenine-N1)-methyltransferase [Methanomassiliicoccales archaeon]|nr:tRNA (adenine-N1)-methyltransferase [Methanomassiliicoccales archaeon]